VKKRADVLNFHSTTQCTARPPRALRAWSTRLVEQAHSKDVSVYSPRRRLEMRCAVAPFGTRCVVTESESSFASFTPNAGSNRSNRRARCRAVRPTSRVACFTTHATRSHLRGVVRGTHKPSRVRVCLAPCAVATPLSDDLSTTIENEGAFGRGAEESSARSVDVVIKDTVSVDGTQDVPEDIDVELTDSAGGDGGDDSGEGGGGDSGSGDSGDAESENNSGGDVAAFAGWAVSAADTVSRQEIATGLIGGAKHALASLFGLNLATAVLLRGAGRGARDGKSVETSAAVTPSSSALTPVTVETTPLVENTQHARGETSPAFVWERSLARRRASATAAVASYGESVDGVVNVVGTALARAAETRKEKDTNSFLSRKQNDRDAGAASVKTESVGITALASMNPGKKTAETAETAAAPRDTTRQEATSDVAYTSSFPTESPIQPTGVHFAVIPNDASDQRVIAALRDAAEAQVAAADAMRAAAAATRAATEATAHVQQLQTCIASASSEGGEDDSACERLSADFKARSDGGTNAARAHAAAAAVAADVATKAAGNKDGYQPLNVASPFLDVETPSPWYRVAKETSVESSPASFSGGENDSRLTQPDRTIPSASSPEEPSASTRAAKTVARFAAAAASKVGAGVAEGARVALPVAREAYKTHAPSVKREAVSLFGTVSSTLQKVWRGGEKQAVRNGRTETVKTPGLKERLGNVFATLRRGSGLFDEERAKKKKEEEEKKKKEGLKKKDERS
jgi:hypothetical protein